MQYLKINIDIAGLFNIIINKYNLNQGIWKMKNIFIYIFLLLISLKNIECVKKYTNTYNQRKRKDRENEFINNIPKNNPYLSLCNQIILKYNNFKYEESKELCKKFNLLKNCKIKSELSKKFNINYILTN